MGVNVKLGVDLSGFKQGITDANAQLKTFDAQLKFASGISGIMIGVFLTYA